jgi:hypothetical protein
MLHTVDLDMRRVVLAVLMLAVMLPAAAFARVAYRCSMDGQVRSECCCPNKATHHDAAPPTSMAAAGCCWEIATVEPASQTATTDPQTTDRPAFVAIAILPSLPAWTQRMAPRTSRAYAPPDIPDRTLFASHCALLL